MRLLVYSANFGKIDPIVTPGFPHNDVDYHLFTDQKVIASAEGWSRVTQLNPGENPRRRARRIKIGMPLMEESKGYDAMVWHDSSIWPVSPILPPAMVWLAERDFATFPHHDWQCVYTEMRKIVQLKKDSKANIDKAHKIIAKSGFPKGYGLSATGVMARRNTDLAKEHAKLWMDAIDVLSIRDQVSFELVGWQLFGKKPRSEWVQDIEGAVIRNKWFAYSKRGRRPG
jgi:hypothetical protein